jgi:hypothetical protein
MKLSASTTLGSWLHDACFTCQGYILKPALLSIVLMENLSQEESSVQRFLIFPLGIRYRSRLRGFCFF